MIKIISLASVMALLLIGCNPNKQNDSAGKNSEKTTNKNVLPSWNNNASKKAIVDFVEATTMKGSPDFIEPTDRIACFDNDGTLWAEQPLYFQFLFALDRVKALSPQHPEWKNKEPFSSLLKGDIKTALAGGEKSIMELMMTTHVGMTTDEFGMIVNDWIATARHPRFNKKYTDCVYQPMLELIAYLKEHAYKVFIVSGGGIEFMRPWAEKVYGVPAEQVVGSSVKTKLEDVNGRPVLRRLAAVNFVDDKAGKPVGINEHIGKHPVMCFGNSDGDFEMLRWTTTGQGPHFGLIVHHDDAVREWAYDRGSSIGKLERGLDEAAKRGWVLVSMKNDWNKIFPGE